MAINRFIYILFITLILLLFIGFDKESIKKEDIDKPMLTFYDSTMYSINEKEVNQIIQSKKALRFKTKDEIYDGTIVIRANTKEGDNLTDTISALYIVKQGNNIKFLNEVKYNRGAFIMLTTDELEYNIQTKIAWNNMPFTAIYNGNKLEGSSFYVDSVNSYFKARQAHFEVISNKDK